MICSVLLPSVALCRFHPLVYVADDRQLLERLVGGDDNLVFCSVALGIANCSPNSLRNHLQSPVFIFFRRRHQGVELEYRVLGLEHLLD